MFMYEARVPVIDSLVIKGFVLFLFKACERHTDSSESSLS